MDQPEAVLLLEADDVLGADGVRLPELLVVVLAVPPPELSGKVEASQRLTTDLGIDSPGSMQGRWIVPAGVLVALPPDLPSEVGAMVEPTASA